MCIEFLTYRITLQFPMAQKLKYGCQTALYRTFIKTTKIMAVFKINSIPLKDVIKSLAESFETDFDNSCNEYFLHLPEHIGTGEISGINFENGLGLAIYNVTFKEDMRLEFILDEMLTVV